MKVRKSDIIARRQKEAHPAFEMIKQRIQERLRTLRLAQTRASELAGLNKGFINDLIAGRSQNPGADELESLARALDCTVEYLLGEQDSLPASDTSPKASGLPLYQIGLTDSDGFFSIPASHRQWQFPSSGAYCITVPDDTMTPRFRIGEVAIVDPSRTILSGGPAVIRQTDGRVAIREVVSISPDKITVRLLKDETVIEIPRDRVEKLDRIVGVCELS